MTPDEVARLVQDLERGAIAVRESERQLAAMIAECRQRGLTWEQVGQGLGVTKQAAQKRFRSSRVSLDDVPLPLAP